MFKGFCSTAGLILSPSTDTDLKKSKKKKKIKSAAESSLGLRTEINNIHGTLQTASEKVEVVLLLM